MLSMLLNDSLEFHFKSILIYYYINSIALYIVRPRKNHTSEVYPLCSTVREPRCFLFVICDFYETENPCSDKRAVSGKSR